MSTCRLLHYWNNNSPICKKNIIDNILILVTHETFFLGGVLTSTHDVYKNAVTYSVFVAIVCFSFFFVTLAQRMFKDWNIHGWHHHKNIYSRTLTNMTESTRFSYWSLFPLMSICTYILYQLRTAILANVISQCHCELLFGSQIPVRDNERKNHNQNTRRGGKNLEHLVP